MANIKQLEIYNNARSLMRQRLGTSRRVLGRLRPLQPQEHEWMRFRFCVGQLTNEVNLDHLELLDEIYPHLYPAIVVPIITALVVQHDNLGRGILHNYYEIANEHLGTLYTELYSNNHVPSASKIVISAIELLLLMKIVLRDFPQRFSTGRSVAELETAETELFSTVAVALTSQQSRQDTFWDKPKIDFFNTVLFAYINGQYLFKDIAAYL